ncbi:hypothetical protein LTR16_005570 [Cryomyces antarcticus]|uniref:Uncharacterized protein n=1 Tax=Cryomyces antarcticus TaxID=329879 RepID=A0ABR0LM99_9PEZI|nr:hypothetical protein LTR16_005570 [Cryomyces antarcticus]
MLVADPSSINRQHAGEGTQATESSTAETQLQAAGVTPASTPKSSQQHQAVDHKHRNADRRGHERYRHSDAESRAAPVVHTSSHTEFCHQTSKSNQSTKDSTTPTGTPIPHSALPSYEQTQGRKNLKSPKSSGSKLHTKPASRPQCPSSTAQEDLHPAFEGPSGDIFTLPSDAGGTNTADATTTTANTGPPSIHVEATQDNGLHEETLSSLHASEMIVNSHPSPIVIVIAEPETAERAFQPGPPSGKAPKLTEDNVPTHGTTINCTTPTLGQGEFPVANNDHEAPSYGGNHRRNKPHDVLHQVSTCGGQSKVRKVRKAESNPPGTQSVTRPVGVTQSTTGDILKLLMYKYQEEQRQSVRAAENSGEAKSKNWKPWFTRARS